MGPNQRQLQHVPSSSNVFHTHRRATDPGFGGRLERNPVGNSTTPAIKDLHGYPVKLSHRDSNIVSPVCQLSSNDMGRAELESEEPNRFDSLESPFSSTSDESEFSSSSATEDEDEEEEEEEEEEEVEERKVRLRTLEAFSNRFPSAGVANLWKQSSSDSLQSGALGRTGCLLLTQLENSNQIGMNSRQAQKIEQLRRSLEQVAAEIHNDNLQLNNLLQARLGPPRTSTGPSKEEMRELRDTIKQLACELKSENQQLEAALQASLASRAEVLKAKSQPPNVTDTALLEAITGLRTSIRTLATEVEEVTGKHVPEQPTLLGNALAAISAKAKGMFSKLLGGSKSPDDVAQKDIFAEINGEKKGMLSRIAALRPGAKKEEEPDLIFPPQAEAQQQGPASSATAVAAVKPEKASRRSTEKGSTSANSSTADSKVTTDDEDDDGAEAGAEAEAPKRSSSSKKRSKASKSAMEKRKSKPSVKRQPSVAEEPTRTNSIISTAEEPVVQDNADSRQSVFSSQGAGGEGVPRVSAASAAAPSTPPPVHQLLPSMDITALRTDVRCYAPDGSLIRDPNKCPQYARVPYPGSVQQPSQMSQAVSNIAADTGTAVPNVETAGGPTPNLLDPEEDRKRVSQTSGRSSGSQAERDKASSGSLAGERRGSGGSGGGGAPDDQKSHDSTPSQGNSEKSQQPRGSEVLRVPSPPRSASGSQRTPSMSVMSASLAEHLNPLIVEALEEIKNSVAIIDREAHRRNTKVPTPPPEAPPPLPDPVIVDAIEDIRRSLRSMQKDAAETESTVSESPEVFQLLQEIKSSLRRLAENRRRADERKIAAGVMPAGGRGNEKGGGDPAPGACRCALRRRKRDPSSPAQPPTS